MPIYEYSCRACGADFEHWHASMRATDPPPCPACASVEVQRKFSAPAVRSGSAGGADARQDAPASPSKPEVFGRKELNAALERRGVKPT